jgi:hypothetical protein
MSFEDLVFFCHHFTPKCRLPFDQWYVERLSETGEIGTFATREFNEAAYSTMPQAAHRAFQPPSPASLDRIQRRPLP